MERKKGGFSLIELMVVAATVAIAASIAVPRYVHHIRSERQSVLQASLGNLSQVQNDFFNKNGRFSKKLEELSWQPPARSPYQCSFDSSSPQAFLVRCQADLDEDPVVDEFTLNHQGKINHLSNDLADPDSDLP